LFPGSEIPALFNLVVVSEIGIGPFRPISGASGKVRPGRRSRQLGF
jgi:hypothetical protein